MNDLRKAAQQALEALDQLTDDVDGTGLSSKPSFDLSLDAITALRAALAQPEQLVVGGDDLPTLTKWTPQRKPLTEEEIYKMFGWYAVPFIRAVEKAHGIGGKHE